MADPINEAHTPGPWLAEDYTDGPPSAWFVVPSTYKGTICEVSAGKPEAKADARLIAAAPQMREALLSARVAVRELCEGQDPANECWATLGCIDDALTAASEDCIDG